MKALLKKDLIILWRQMKLNILLIVIFAFTPSLFQNNFSILYAAMIPYTLCAYDEKNKWDKMAKMMPYTPQQIVLGKYIFGWASVVLTFIASVIVSLFDSRINNNIFDISSLVFILPIGFMVIDASLPLVFKLGVEKGRYINLFIIGFIIACASIISTSTALSFLSNTIWIYPFLFVLAIVLTYLSVNISAKFYRDKEF